MAGVTYCGKGRGESGYSKKKLGEGGGGRLLYNLEMTLAHIPPGPLPNEN